MVRRCTSRSAFTLVELLVVIGIIAVLLALLMPMMGRARQQAQLTACKSNLRSIGQALEMYSNDYRRFPDGITSGNFAYRMRPGLRTSGAVTAMKPQIGSDRWLSFDRCFASIVARRAYARGTQHMACRTCGGCK